MAKTPPSDGSPAQPDPQTTGRSRIKKALAYTALAASVGGPVAWVATHREKPKTPDELRKQHAENVKLEALSKAQSGKLKEELKTKIGEYFDRFVEEKQAHPEYAPLAKQLDDAQDKKGYNDFLDTWNMFTNSNHHKHQWKSGDVAVDASDEIAQMVDIQREYLYRQELLRNSNGYFNTLEEWAKQCDANVAKAKEQFADKTIPEAAKGNDVLIEITLRDRKNGFEQCEAFEKKGGMKALVAPLRHHYDRGEFDQLGEAAAALQAGRMGSAEPELEKEANMMLTRLKEVAKTRGPIVQPVVRNR